MGRRRARRLVSLAGAVVVAWLAAPPAVAAPAAPSTWVVDNPSSDGAFRFAELSLVLQNTDTLQVVACSTVARVAGELPSGTFPHDPPRVPRVGQLLAEYQCTDAQGGPVTVAHPNEGPWQIAVESYDPDTNQVVSLMGPPLGVAFEVRHGAGPTPVCDYVLSADQLPLRFMYSNSTSTFTYDDGARVLFPQGPDCEGIAHEDDHVTISGTFAVTPAVTIVQT
jgi:hypothetical protein